MPNYRKIKNNFVLLYSLIFSLLVFSFSFVWDKGYLNHEIDTYVIDSNSSVTGYVDSVSIQGNVGGWAYSAEKPDQALEVVFYGNALEGSDNSVYLGSTKASNSRPDLTAALGITPNHGFNWTMPYEYRFVDTIFVYGVYNGSLELLNQTQNKLYPGAKGYIDGINSKGEVSGWAFDPQLDSSSIRVHFYINSPAGTKGSIGIGATTADISRPDLKQNLGINPKHGFKFTIPKEYLGSVHRVYAYGISKTQNGNNSELLRSPALYIPPKSSDIANDKNFYILPIIHQLRKPNIEQLVKDMPKTLNYNGTLETGVKLGLTLNVNYLNDTLGSNRSPSGLIPSDYEFDPNFVDSNRGIQHENDNLNEMYKLPIKYNLPVAVNLVGIPWGELIDCPAPGQPSCSSVSNNIATKLEQDVNNLQMNQFGNVVQEYSINGEAALQKNLTLSFLSKTVMKYRERNLKQAASYIYNNKSYRALTKALSIEPDLFLTVWGSVDGDKVYDYNPVNVEQFRQWLFCNGSYSDGGHYYLFRRDNNTYTKFKEKCFKSVAELNQKFGTKFTTLGSIVPPVDPYSNISWWQEWRKYNASAVFIANFMNLVWASEVGFAPEMIYGHIGYDHEVSKYISNLPSGPFTLGSRAGATVVAGGVHPFGNGSSLYGEDSRKIDGIIKSIKEVNSNWGVFEGHPAELNPNNRNFTYENSMATLENLYKSGAKFYSPIAWHVDPYAYDANGPANIRGTVFQRALKDFMSDTSRKKRK